MITLKQLRKGSRLVKGKMRARQKRKRKVPRLRNSTVAGGVNVLTFYLQR